MYFIAYVGNKIHTFFIPPSELTNYLTFQPLCRLINQGLIYFKAQKNIKKGINFLYHYSFHPLVFFVPLCSKANEIYTIYLTSWELGSLNV